MQLNSVTILAAVSIFLMQAAHASHWQPVESYQGERVEIDKTRIARIGEGRTVAWSRLVLGRNVPIGDNAAQYSTVEALNRYDCENKRFTTIKRVFLQGEKIVKQETVESPREMIVVAGSVDEKLLTEACKLRTVGEMKQVAEKADKVAAAPKGAAGAGMPAAEPPPKAMYADMRSAGANKPAQLRSVSDTHAAPEHAAPESHAPAKTEAPAKHETAAKSEAPTRFELPSKAELAAKAAAEQAALLPPAPTPPAAVPAPVAPPAAPAAHAPAPAAPAAHAPAPAASHSATTPAAAPRAHSPTYVRSLSKLPRGKPAAPPPQEHANAHPVHWSYAGEGAPANWSKLQPDFATCSTGKRQSPIDIKEGIRVDLEPIRFNYRITPIRIVDNGHTIQVNVGGGNSISIMGRQYELVQFHFHRPAEERVNGRSFEMVAHLVHKDYEGNLAVVAVLLESGTEHPVIQTVWDNLPLEAKLEVTPGVSIDMNQFLPDSRSYWTYMGSLTTPPCTEGVTWVVLKQPQQMSSEQIAIFSRFYRHNARPVQPGNNRLVKESR